MTCLLWAWFSGMSELPSRVGPWGMVGLGVVLFTPTLFQPFWQVKVFKVISRFFLGISVVLLWYGAMVLLPWTFMGFVLRLVFVAIFVQTFRLTQKWRSKKTSNPCERCPFGVYPFCKGNQMKVNTLVTELQRRACPEDKAFVKFAMNLASAGWTDTNIEIMSIGEAIRDSSGERFGKSQ